MEIERNKPLVAAEGEVALRAVWCEGHCPLPRLPGTLREHRHGGAVGIEKRIGVRDPRPRLHEAGIQRRGLLVEAEHLPQAGGIVGSAVPDFLTLEEGVVGGEVLRGLLGKPLLLACSEGAAQSLSHLRRDVRLHLEHIRDRRVERLLPLGRRGVRARHVDELRTHVDAARPGTLVPAHGCR